MEAVMPTMLYEVHYLCQLDEKETEGRVFMQSEKELEDTEILERLKSNYRGIARRRINNIQIKEVIMRSGQIDLEKTVMPFYDKVKLQNKITEKQSSECLKYINELKEVIRLGICQGRGLDAVKDMLSKLEKVYNKQKVKSEVLKKSENLFD